MNCQDAQELLSALYDGEPVPAEFAAHVDQCQNCREGLLAYSQIGAEFRLLASRRATSPVIPATALLPTNAHRSPFARFTDRILVPKLAVAATALLVLAMSAGLISLHAQQPNNHLWFVFMLTEKGKSTNSPFIPKFVVQTGYDDINVTMTGPHAATGSHVAVSSVQSDRVELAVRSRFYTSEADDSKRVATDLKDLRGRSFTYHPGDALEIPVEGGAGTLILHGEVLDHKPRFIGMGLPAEPAPDQLVLASPVLIGGDKVLFRTSAMSIANRPEGVAIYAPGTGLFEISLEPRPDAVKGTANWSQLDFTAGGESYAVLTASQLSGGDQPRTLWVKLDAKYSPVDPRLKGGYVGAGPLTSPAPNSPQ